MKREKIETLAAEYVLGTLDSDARRLLGDRLATDPDLRQAVQSWEERLCELSLGEPARDPPPGLWERIAPALNQALGNQPPGDQTEPAAEGFTITVRAGEGQWRELCPGVHKKHLFTDREAGYEAFLLRYEPGARLPAHEHSMTEECVMLEGDAWIGDLLIKAGDYHVIAAGVPHPEIRSDNGGIAYVRGEIRAAG